MYWNITATVVAPCGHTVTDALQTHFMGEAGSCVNYYKVGEQIPELAEYSGTLPDGDYLLGECSTCGTWFDCGAVIEEGRVVNVLPPRMLATAG